MRAAIRGAMSSNTSNETGDSMAQQGTAQGLSGRALALARRKALSGSGKAALASAAKASPAPRAAPAPRVPTRAATAARAPTAAGLSGRAASLARRKAMSSRGKVAVQSNDRVRSEPVRKAPAAPVQSSTGSSRPESKRDGCSCGCKGKREATAPEPVSSVARSNGRNKIRTARRPDVAANPGRAASLARRRAQSSRGKAGLNGSGVTAAQTARATNPDLSGRDLARALREQRSKRGGAGQRKSDPCGRQRPRPETSAGAAQDAPWKVGASQTTHGQTVTGTMVGRSQSVTGDEASTCRAVTGTEYMGADIFRDFLSDRTRPGRTSHRCQSHGARQYRDGQQGRAQRHGDR